MKKISLLLKMPSQERVLLEQMIELLLEEKGETPVYPVQSLEEGQLLAVWRGLVNQRQPGQLRAAYLEAEAAFLNSYHRRHQVSMTACQPTKHRGIYLYLGDLCHLQVDGVVNAANSQMLGCFIPHHACLDNALHTFAGIELREECAKMMAAAGRPEPVGQVRVTSAYHLPATYLFHTVGPVIPKGKSVSPIRRQLLAQCYLSCLDQALVRGLSSLAFPALSTGEFGYPKEEAAEVAISTVLRWLEEHDYPLDIIFSTFTEEDRIFYENQLRES